MIVACGEALVDLVPEPAGEETLYRPVLGGSLYNVALGIARLGGRAAYLWELSSDALGRRLLAALEADGVDVSAVRVSDRATPVAVVDLSGEEARYNIADPDGVMVDTVPPALPAGAGCLVIGSAVLAREPVAEALETLAAAAPSLAIDYNVRPPSIADLATYKARLLRLSRIGGLVKASVADLSALGESDPEGFMRDLVAEGAALAVLTRGAAGASAFSAHGEASAPSRAETVVDTVGAGDAFMVGCLSWLQAREALRGERMAKLDGADLSALLEAAQRVAAATCRARGAVMPLTRDLSTTVGMWMTGNAGVG